MPSTDKKNGWGFLFTTSCGLRKGFRGGELKFKADTVFPWGDGIGFFIWSRVYKGDRTYTSLQEIVQ